MPSMEQVDRLRAYADISVEEARDALAEAGDDLLEAVILLERRGRIKPPAGGGRRETGAEQEPGPEPRERGAGRRPPPEESFVQVAGRFFHWLGQLLQKGLVNTFEAGRRGEHILSLPVLVLILLVLFLPWITLPLLIVGLFFDYRYAFRGPHMGQQVNHVMDSAASAASAVKKDVKESADRYHERDRSDH